MALTPLRESLERTGTAFDQKLNQLVGLAESVKASEVRKQQMAEKLASEKDLIQFRSDVQLQQKKKYYKDITEPAQQAERDYERMQQQIEQLNESRKSTRDSIQEMQKKTSQGQHSSLYKYNLEQFNFNVQTQTDEKGNIAGFQPAVYYGSGDQAEQIPATQYYDMVANLTAFGDQLETADTLDGEYKTRMDTEDGIVYLGNDDEGNKIIQQIKSDPEVRKQYYGLYQEGRLQVSSEYPEKGGADGIGGDKTSQGALNNTMPVITSLSQKIKEEGNGGVVNFGYSDADLADDWGIGPWEDKENYSSAIDFTTSVGDVQLQLNKVVQQTLPEDAKFDISELSEEEKTMIVNGEVNDETLESIAPKERAKHVRRMAGMADTTRQTYHELFKYHNAYESAYQAYIKGAGQNISRNDYTLDLMNAPKDLRTEKEFMKLMKETDQQTRSAKLMNVYQKYSKNATGQHLNQ